MRTLLVVFGATLLALLAGCARAPLKGPQNAMRRVSAPELAELKDDLPLEDLVAAIDTQIKLLSNSPNVKSFTFGERVIPKEKYLEGLAWFAQLVRKAPNQEALFKAIENEFEFYEVYGDKEWGDVFITSYFEPLIKGSLKKTKVFTQPLYTQPSDLVAVDLTVFDEKFAGERKYRGRVVDGKLLPYYSREEIDSGGALKGKKLELAWVDPLDAYAIQVQGSGTIDLGGPKGKPKILRVGYAEKNGQKYESLGKFLRDVIPPELLTWQSIEAHVRSLSPEKRQELFNRNPSYVFFRKVDEPALTYMGVPATDGRTIATDPKYFPKGALGFLISQKPAFDGVNPLVPATWQPMARFVLDQDVGGAITGGGRLDLFWGRGDDAKRAAGVMKQRGRLFYIAPKESK